MIVAHITSISHSKVEMLGVQILILISLLMIALWTEKIFRKLPSIVMPLALLPIVIFIVYVIHPSMPYVIFKAFHPWRLAALLIFLALAIFGFYAISRQKEFQRTCWFFGVSGILPMFFSFYSIYGVVLQVVFTALVLHHCLRYGHARDFQIRMIRSCTRFIVLALSVSWLMAAWITYEEIAFMTRPGKPPMLIFRYFGLFDYLVLEIFLLLPLHIWLLRQDKLRQTQKQGETP
jgi:hypothetical protein